MNARTLRLIGIAIAACLLGCSEAPNDPEPAKTDGATPTNTRAATENAPGAKAAHAGMPVYITPFYNSIGPEIAVGAISELLRSVKPDGALALSEQLKSKRDSLRPEAMFVTAIRLYDLGAKDEAVYWFYTAQYRARLLSALLAPGTSRSMGGEGFELQQAYGAFMQLSGEYINGYGFGDLSKLDKTLQTVLAEGQTLPDINALFPKLTLIPRTEWEAKHAEIAKGMNGLINAIRKDADSIRESRKKNGIDGKY
jgi:hypothetical protein